MRLKVNVDSSECWATNEKALLWQEALLITKDERIKRQQETNECVRLWASINPDRLIVVRAEPRIARHSLEAMEVGLKPPHLLPHPKTAHGRL